MKSSSETSSTRSDAAGEPADGALRFTGTGVSAGVVMGKALIFGTEHLPVQENTIPPEGVDREVARFHEAVRKSEQQITDIRREIAHIVGEENAAIFDSHLMLVSDRAIVARVTEQIRTERRNAEFIFRNVIDRYCNMLSSVKDQYIRDRIADVRDVADRVIRNLQDFHPVDLSKLTEPLIIVATDLSPSDTARMDKQNVIGFVTSIGSRTSHTAIMARAMSIPAVVGLTPSLSRISTGDTVIVDGTHGVVIARPDAAAKAEYARRIREQTEWFERITVEAVLPAETRDAYHVRLAANIELPEEVANLKKRYGVGIGLFRTEFLFVQSSTMTDEEEQYRAYKKIAQEIYPNSVIFRTLDIGGDKFISDFRMPSELNPFLGMRAIRFCLSQPNLFKAQLRAILRASAHGKVRVMFPMIATFEELRASLDILEEVKRELKEQGHAYNPHLDVGIMIEVPSAAMIADQLAPHVDFFSVGTNDLVQYSLAVDRSNPSLAYLYQPAHPSIIRLLKRVVDAAYANGKWVGICGEMASEPLLAPLVLGLGIHELSMSPVAIPQIKRLIRRMRMYEAEGLVREAMACDTEAEVIDLCRAFLKRVAPDILPE